MIATDSSTSIALEKTRRRVARWREARPYRGAPMPAALWTAAIALARQHGLYTTARTLRIDHGSLTKRRDAAGAGRVPAPRGRPGSGRAGSTSKASGAGACASR